MADNETVVTFTSDDRNTSANPGAARSIRPVIEHALAVYYDGNAELARMLIDRLLAEDQNR
jgi:hypothetical protein